MKLYLIKQSVNQNYDTYDSAVVAALSEDDAKMTHPSGVDADMKYWGDSWCKTPDEVSVEYIGEAPQITEREVICASFNAG